MLDDRMGFQARPGDNPKDDALLLSEVCRFTTFGAQRERLELSRVDAPLVEILLTQAQRKFLIEVLQREPEPAQGIVTIGGYPEVEQRC